MALMHVAALGGGAGLSAVASTQDTYEADDGTTDLNTISTPVADFTPSEATGLASAGVGVAGSLYRNGGEFESLKEPVALAGLSAGVTGVALGFRNRLKAGRPYLFD